jgi:hypothetical protein
MIIGDRDVAEFCHLGLRLGVLSLADVHAWADDMIVARDEPPTWAIDLSTAELEAAIRALNAVPGKPTTDVPVKLIVALVRRRWSSGQVSLGQVQSIGWQLHGWDRLPLPAVGGDWGVVLYCEYEEFEQGYRTDSQMRNSVDDKLAPYAEFEQMIPEWIERSGLPLGLHSGNPATLTSGYCPDNALQF